MAQKRHCLLVIAYICTIFGNGYGLEWLSIARNKVLRHKIKAVNDSDGEQNPYLPSLCRSQEFQPMFFLPCHVSVRTRVVRKVRGHL